MTLWSSLALNNKQCLNRDDISAKLKFDENVLNKNINNVNERNVSVLAEK
jgi:hypothetical protein